MRGGKPPQAATVHSAPACQEQDALPQSRLRTGREPQAHGVLPGPALGESLHEIAFREANFAEPVREYAGEDEFSSSAENLAGRCLSVPQGVVLDYRMSRAPSPAVIHVRLRCCAAWMAAGTLMRW